MDERDSKPNSQDQNNTDALTQQVGQVNMGDTIDGRNTTQMMAGLRVSNNEDVNNEDRYNMKHPRRGMAVIINNRSFQSSTGMNERNGTDVDASNIFQRLNDLGFEVIIKTNQTTRQMVDLMSKAGKMNHSDADCFACVILSHGEEGVVYGTDGVVPIEKLTEPFKGNKCESLRGKPKMFFIQACRGQKFDEGVETTDDDGEGLDETDANTVHRIPAEADFLMAYSVVPGYFSWRNSTRGSWFIQALCSVLEKYGENPDYDILRIMTRVNRMVAYDFESRAAREFMNRKKQIPSIVSMLTKEMYFTPRTG
ncbi:unnamed protein product [Owenia fusiformis]|uniref:Caspase-3 n=1 Tax=Owenia fusiformis TaxID=6347 RepID=A0A8S4PPE6_OWEFU|nr:unnamed protein product [Owenia fusiformis]